MTPHRPGFDYVIVGGGLQGCLLTHALAHHRPDATVLLVEKGDHLCGNHTWSFHESDVPVGAEAWVRRLEAHRWAGYRVRFPNFERRIAIPYLCIPSDVMRERTETLAEDSEGRITIRRGIDCEVDSSTEVTLGNEETVRCRLVVDCRGLGRGGPSVGCGYQAFLGEEYELTRAWPAEEPAVMDAKAEQSAGFEFLYELPLGPDRVLLEYTRFSDEPKIDEVRARSMIAARLRAAGEGGGRLVRTEQGCLPMPFEENTPPPGPAVAGGYAGGWFHAATGYSVPLALRFAETVARCPPEEAADALTQVSAADAGRGRFARFLNRLLFRLVHPRHRWKIFRRFYRVLPEARIARFYGYRFTRADAARIVIGWPPSGLRPLTFGRSFFTSARASS